MCSAKSFLLDLWCLVFGALLFASLFVVNFRILSSMLIPLVLMMLCVI